MAGTLSGGEQQMLAVGRALMAKPKLVMMDEPSLGLAPIVVQRHLRHHPARSTRQGITVLLIEQNANMALKIADSGLRHADRHDHSCPGDGPASWLENEEVKAAYLGKAK